MKYRNCVKKIKKQNIWYDILPTIYQNAKILQFGPYCNNPSPAPFQHGDLVKPTPWNDFGCWWARAILFKLCMALLHEFHHPRTGEPTESRVWQPDKSVMHTGPKHMHSHYEPGIWAALTVPHSPKRHAVLNCGKRCIVFCVVIVISENFMKCCSPVFLQYCLQTQIQKTSRI